MRILGVAIGSIRFSPAVMSGVLALAVALPSLGCQQPAAVPEDGAVLLRVAIPAGGPVPGELRIWVYDGTGVLFGNARFPEQGTLPVPANRRDLGTILIQPGAVSGALRFHVRGLSAGARVSDAIGGLAAFAHDRATVDLVLSVDVPRDDDLDDVPDGIDDRPGRFNPAQGGCQVVDLPDASPDATLSPDGGMADGGGNADVGVAGDAPTGDAVPTDVRVADASVVDASVADASVADASVVDVRVVDAPAPDAPVSDGGIAESAREDVRAVDAPIADVRPADALAADVVKVDGPAADAGTDGARKSLGTSCAIAGECASGFCADGICCLTACDQPCQQCLLGACFPVTRQQDNPQCAGTMMCNPTGKCVGGD